MKFLDEPEDYEELPFNRVMVNSLKRKRMSPLIAEERDSGVADGEKEKETPEGEEIEEPFMIFKGSRGTKRRRTMVRN